MKRLLIPVAALLPFLVCAAVPEPTESARLFDQIARDYPKTNLRQ